ncbi:MAG: hydroxymethylbilane synthase [Pseudomonadota bacterium]|nr:hydroxymethylbilane synthase [Pseudomonadota bacterium]
MKIRIGTRGSHLARTQSTTVASELERLGHEIELIIIKTAGDRSTATSFGDIGPQGVFVREIEQALLDKVVDIAVHSYKDLPTQSPNELTIAAVPARLDAADALVMRKDAVTKDDQELPIAPGMKIGTASVRRQAWIKHLRPDITVEPTRGNVPTRIGRLKEGFDGVVLAAAGLQRLKASTLTDAPDLNLEDVVIKRILPDVFVPAPAQGALAVQCRNADTKLLDVLQKLDDADTRRCIYAERVLLERVEGGCDLAFGAYATPDNSFDGGFQLISLLEHNGKLLRSKARGADPITLAEPVWETFARRLK